MDEKSELLARAQASFKRQGKTGPETTQARQEYEDKQAEADRNMHRLRAARLAREATKSAPSPSEPFVPTRKQAKRIYLGK
jgi:hypothetical protein